MGVIAAAVALVTRLLAAPALGGGRRRGVRGGGCARGGRGVGVVGVGLGLTAEELLLAEAEAGLQTPDLILELGLALCGALVHGLVVTGLLSCVEEGGEQGAVLTGEGVVVGVVRAVVGK